MLTKLLLNHAYYPQRGASTLAGTPANPVLQELKGRLSSVSHQILRPPGNFVNFTSVALLWVTCFRFLTEILALIGAKTLRLFASHRTGGFLKSFLDAILSLFTYLLRTKLFYENVTCEWTIKIKMNNFFINWWILFYSKECLWK